MVDHELERPLSDGERRRFRDLQELLPPIWEGIRDRRSGERHTSVVVPSLSFDPEEMAKVLGVAHYEERLLFSLMRLRDPRCRVIYLTSQPVHPEIVDYYLQLLVGVPAGHARRRLELVSLYDGGEAPLTAKILARPRLLERLRGLIGDPRRAYLTCFNSTGLERRLALVLGIPLNGVDPDLLWLGTKSGSRKVFQRAGTALPEGSEDVRSVEEVVAALDRLATLRSSAGGGEGLRRAVVKLDASFSGEGNALYTYPRPLPAAPAARRRALAAALGRLSFSAVGLRHDRFLDKLARMGGVVEEFLEAGEVHSPSVQMRIHPNGEPAIISTHEQVLGGDTGQVYVGCRFPAAAEYRGRIQEEAMKIGRVLAAEGVVSRFGVDFLLARDGDGPWAVSAIEINLRMGGTTHPFQALEFLTGGRLDPESGEFLSPRGRRKYYFATDNLKSAAYRGLLLEDLMDILTVHRLHFEPATETGVLFHMMGALSRYGKLGVTAIGDSPQQADALYRRTASVLDQETGAGAADRGHAEGLIDLHPPEME